VVICLERGADLHIAQLMPLPPTVSCFSKIQIGFTFLVAAHLGSPGQRAVKRGVWLTQLVPDKGPLDGCVYVDKYSYLFTLAREVSSVGLTLVHMDRHQVHLWLQSNQLEWIALGPEYEYPLSQSIHVSMFHPFGCV